MKIIIQRASDYSLSITIPKIGVYNFQIWAVSDMETPWAHRDRAREYAKELIRRFRVGETYAAGYRKAKEGSDHKYLVLKRTPDRGVHMFEKVVGIDDDFREISS